MFMTQDFGLGQFGLAPKAIHRNLSVHELVEHTIKNGEGILGPNGCTIVNTGKFTGRSPKDKYIVDEGEASEKVWWGPVNQKITEEVFDKLVEKVVGRLNGRDQVYLFEGFAGADEDYRMPIRIVTEKAWHNHFVNNMFIVPTAEQLETIQPQFTILNGCGITAEDWEELGLNSEVFVAFHLSKGLAVIGGTSYAGEMKKGIFSVLNYKLPLQGVLSMHCSANIGEEGDTALFFGLSGTGKTTLSADPNRNLIGDDEHGWSDNGVFNFEGGCYAKTINLSKEKEPDIWDAIRFEAVLENVSYDEHTRVVDFDDAKYTENTRVSYPITHIDNIILPSRGGNPKNIIFLTCDAFGVLPPVSRLTPGQAMYHFISGYTAKVAGTERGITEPQATFSSCFGSPFLPLHPTKYAELLGQKMEKHNVNAYLVNTGWTGGQYGTGHRINLPDTRAIITAILDHSIERSEMRKDEYFGFEVPVQLDGVDQSVLNPIDTWEDKEGFHVTAKKLVTLFQENFKKFESTSSEFSQYGPKL
jgi:phosphoenolpyruvate carboxykinase (ATP)